MKSGKIDYQRANSLLSRHNQEHLLNFYDTLSSSRKQALLEQIEGLDFENIPFWLENYVKNPSPAQVSADLAPAKAYPAVPDDIELQGKYQQARKLGTQIIKAGKVAAFVVAGGQGTRLGFDGPKGNLPISTVKGKTLFRIFAETIRAASAKYDTALAWYIMTSPQNHDQTVEIFKNNDYYGLSESDVFIFQQETLPNFSLDGKILLADEATIAASPDGHGGSLKALYCSGAIADMKKRRVEYISYFQVDNALINIFDPLFIGLHASDGASMSSKALVKTGPTEKVGNFCLADDRITVIEYSDLPYEQSGKVNPDGSLVFQLGSIAIHIINTAFVEELNAGSFRLPIHRAVKKIPYIDSNGRKIAPSEPNGVKLETFVFDALPLADKSIILETIRSQEFAPAKNASGTDSVEVAKNMMTARAAEWLENAGVTIPKKADGTPDCTIEIAPSFAIEKQDIIEKKDRLATINPGEKIYLE